MIPPIIPITTVINSIGPIIDFTPLRDFVACIRIANIPIAESSAKVALASFAGSINERPTIAPIIMPIATVMTIKFFMQSFASLVALISPIIMSDSNPTAAIPLARFSILTMPINAAVAAKMLIDIDAIKTVIPTFPKSFPSYLLVTAIRPAIITPKAPTTNIPLSISA